MSRGPYAYKYVCKISLIRMQKQSVHSKNGHSALICTCRHKTILDIELQSLPEATSGEGVGIWNIPNQALATAVSLGLVIAHQGSSILKRHAREFNKLP